MNINRDIRRLQRDHSFLKGQNLSKCSYQYKALKDEVIFSGNKLKGIENRQRRLNYQKIRGTVQHDKQKNKCVATIIRKQLCLHQARKKYQNLKMGHSLYVLCAIVAYIEKISGNI